MVITGWDGFNGSPGSWFRLRTETMGFSGLRPLSIVCSCASVDGVKEEIIFPSASVISTVVSTASRLW